MKLINVSNKLVIAMKCLVCNKTIIIDSFGLLFKVHELCEECASKFEYKYHISKNRKIKIIRYYLDDIEYFNDYNFDIYSYVRNKHKFKYLRYHKTLLKTNRNLSHRKLVCYYVKNDLQDIDNVLKNIVDSGLNRKIILYEINFVPQ